jgi:transcription factor TFIIIB component B''
VKKPKRSSARSNATAQALAQGKTDAAPGATPVETIGDTTLPQPDERPAPKRKPATTRRRATASKKKAATVTAGADEEGGADAVAGAEAGAGAEGEGGQAEADVENTAPKKRRKPAKRKEKSAATVAVEDDGEGAGRAVEGEEDGGESSDPEAHEIDPNALSMFDLSHDVRHGKQSERGKKMAEIDWEKVAQERRDAANALVANFQREQQIAEDRAAGIDPDVVPSVENAAGRGSQAPDQDNANRSANPTPAPPPRANDDLSLGFMLDADGNIVADEATLTFTRDAAAQAAAHDSAPVEEFNDLTQNINRTAYMNQNRRDPADRVPVWKWKSDPWSEDETDKFYEALRMFGTDFFIISKMFPPKTRRMIKAKFTREEKLDPTRIDAALTGKCTTPMNLEHYSKATGRDVSVFTKYDDLEHVQKVIGEGMKEREVELSADAKREAKEREKEAKLKEKEKLKEEKKAARKAKTKKAKAGMGGFGGGMGGGGPEEDVGVDAD